MARNIDRYVCPFCCKAVDPARFHLVCHEFTCTDKFLRNCNPTDQARRASKFHMGEEIDVEGSIYRGIDPHSKDAITTTHHIVYHPKNNCCDICGKTSTAMLCPVCHGPIPPDADKGSNIIAVLGGARSGKSHYTAVLVDSLLRICNEYGVEMREAVPRTREVHEMLKKRLAEGRDEECTSEPMVYYLSSKNFGNSGFVRTLALFDTPGADLKTEGKIQSIATGTLITGAAGILFLIDPLTLPVIREKLRLPPQDDEDPSERLDEIADTIRLRRHQLASNVDVPLAVVLTKVDKLMRKGTFPEEEEVLFGPESALNIPRRSDKHDAENLEQVSIEVEEYLSRFAGEKFMKSVNRFNTHAFFAVSSLGHNPAADTVPIPFRVEDPIIWMTDGIRK